MLALYVINGSRTEVTILTYWVEYDIHKQIFFVQKYLWWSQTKTLTLLVEDLLELKNRQQQINIFLGEFILVSCNPFYLLLALVILSIIVWGIACLESLWCSASERSCWSQNVFKLNNYGNILSISLTVTNWQKCYSLYISSWKEDHSGTIRFVFFPETALLAKLSNENPDFII